MPRCLNVSFNRASVLSVKVSAAFRAAAASISPSTLNITSPDNSTLTLFDEPMPASLIAEYFGIFSDTILLLHISGSCHELAPPAVLELDFGVVVVDGFLVVVLDDDEEDEELDFGAGSSISPVTGGVTFLPFEPLFFELEDDLDESDDVSFFGDELEEPDGVPEDALSRMESMTSCQSTESTAPLANCSANLSPNESVTFDDALC